MDRNDLAADVLVRTRQSLHAVAEMLLAGPQYEQSHDIRLRAATAGFATVVDPQVSVEGTDLLMPTGRVPLEGTIGDVAMASGLQARDLRDVYDDGPQADAAYELAVDPNAAKVVADAFARGEESLRAFAPLEMPVLWPEHFDIAITLDEVTYGVSPGDRHVAEPYAYVAPHAVPAGDFWTHPFGAVRPLSELESADEIVDFFVTGQERSSEPHDG